MLNIHDPSQVSSIRDPDIRTLAQLRFEQILAGEPYDYDRHGYMIVVETGDTIAELEKETCCCIMRDLITDSPFDDPDFTPSFEILEEHQGSNGKVFYEMLFITTDEGFGVTIFIPHQNGVPSDLLAMCQEYATPAVLA